MRKISILLATALMLGALAAPATALGFIHEKIAAACRAGGEEVIPPGQVRDGQSFVRALQATGIISSIDTSVAGQVTINFDLSKPSAKYMAGPVLTIPDGFGPGVDLILNPLPMLDPSFPAHANCRNLR